MSHSKNPVDSVAITGYPLPWNIHCPIWPNVNSVSDSFSLANSTVDTAVNRSPAFVSLNANALSNPAGNPAIPNFVLDTSRFRLSLQVNLPLYGLGYITMQDTVKFSFGTTNVSQIEWVKFLISTENGFPLGVTQQVIFTDSLYHKLDSLLTQPQQQTILAANVGGPPNYKVVSPSSKSLQITITKDKIARISRVKYLLINSRFTTTNNGTSIVKFYSDYGINIKLGVQAQGHTIVYPNHPSH
jgi:hypothetical protein